MTWVLIVKILLMKISVLEIKKFKILEKTWGVIMQVTVQLVEFFYMPNMLFLLAYFIKNLWIRFVKVTV